MKLCLPFQHEIDLSFMVQKLHRIFSTCFSLLPTLLTMLQRIFFLWRSYDDDNTDTPVLRPCSHAERIHIGERQRFARTCHRRGRGCQLKSSSYNKTGNKNSSDRVITMRLDARKKYVRVSYIFHTISAGSFVLAITAVRKLVPFLIGAEQVLNAQMNTPRDVK